MHSSSIFNQRNGLKSLPVEQIMESMKAQPTKDHSLSPQELCVFDDFATSLIVDSVMGFQTHKMHPRFDFIAYSTLVSDDAI